MDLRILRSVFLMMGMMVLGVGSLEGQSIFENPITGTNPNTDNPYTTGQIVDPNITVSGIGRGSGINGTNTNNRYNANTWNSASLDADKYFYFILTPNSGYEIDFASFVYTGQASGTGPTSFAFRSSVDGFASNIGTPTATGATISLTGAEYQNITSPIEFRLYGWGASGSGGTFSVNDFEFNGSVNFVCTPPTTQATTFDATNLQSTQMDISWTQGDGDNVLVLARQGSPVNADPVDGVSYTANAAFGSGQQIGSDNFVVYNGNGTGVTVTGLAPNTTYHYAIYEYSSPVNCYLKPGLTGNAATPPPPSLSVNPATLSGFTYVFGAGPSASQAYALSGANLFPASGSIQIIAPTNYEVSPNNTAFTSSYDASYSGGTINTTIYVRLKAGLAVGSYNGEIVSNSGGGASTQNVTCNGTVTMPPITLVYSQGSGAWGAADLWNTAADGSGTPVTAPNEPTISVVIQNGHTITLPSSPVYKTDNVTINAGGTLSAGSSTNRFISVYGSSILVNGTAGGDGLGLNIEGPSCVLTGSGNITPSRIKKDDNSALGSATTNFIIEDCTVNLSWSSSGALYNTSSPNASTARAFNVTIASNATVNVVGDVSINGPLGNNSFGDVGTFTINGTLDIGGDLLVRTRATVGDGIQYVINGTVEVGGNVVGNSDNTGSDIATVVVNSGGVLRLKGDGNMFTLVSAREVYNLNAGSEVDYDNPSAQTIRQFTYSNITSSGGGAKTLAGNTLVNGILNLSSGNIILNANTLTLGPSGAIAGGSSASYVQTNGAGVFKRTVGTTSALLPVGNSAYNPILLSRSAGSGVYNTRVLDGVFENGLFGNPLNDFVVDRTWDVTADGPVGTLTLMVQWNTSDEIGGFNRANCAVSHYIGGEWVADALGAASGGPGIWTRTRTGITSLSAFAVGSEGSLLPIELLAFDARQQGRTALLTWRTASEKDNDFMAVERSADGRGWDEIGRVAGAGTTSIPQDYRFIDERPWPGLNYYRLRQVDFDGSYEYHRTVALDFRPEAGKLGWQLSPSPAQDRLQVRLDAPSPQEGRVLIVNMQGQALGREVLPAGATELELDLSRLPAGVYTLLLQQGGQRWAERFVKK